MLFRSGVLSGTFAGTVGVLSVSGAVVVRLNTTGGAVDESVTVDGRPVRIVFGAAEGDLFKVSVSGASLRLGDFVTIVGDVSFTGDSFAGANLEVFLGAGPARLDDGSINPLATGVLLTGATVGVVRVAGSTDRYAVFAVGSVQLLGVAGATVSGTATLRFNDTGAAVDRTLTIDGSDSQVIVRVGTGAAGGTLAAFEGVGIEIEVAGQRLRGDFSFSPRDDGSVAVVASGVSLDLGGVVQLSAGAGTLVIGQAGIAGDVSGTVTLNVPGVSVGAGLSLRFNSTGADVDLDGDAATTGDVIAAGPYLHLAGTDVTLTVAGQVVIGSFVVERATTSTGGTVTRMPVAIARTVVDAAYVECAGRRIDGLPMFDSPPKIGRAHV